MRLIDADEISYTMIYKENWMAGKGTEVQGVWKEDIDAMPTVYLERKKGSWVAMEEIPCAHDTKFRIYCSECKHRSDDNPTHYCPNCGADMRGEEE